jgi:hypothetical protein
MVKDSDLKGLVMEVNKKMDEGWQPIGGPVYGGPHAGYWVQVIGKPTLEAI